MYLTGTSVLNAINNTLYNMISHCNIRNCEKQSELTALVIEQVLGSSELATK